MSRLLSAVKDGIHDPEMAIRAYFEQIALTASGVDVASAANPLVGLMEVSAAAAVASVHESMIHVRQITPALATQASELYSVMADTDYAGVFATPAKAQITLVVNLNDLEAKSHTYTPTNGQQHRDYYIPAGTMVSVGEVYFTLLYGIYVRLVGSGLSSQLQIFYDTSEISPMQSLETNLLTHQSEIRQDPSGAKWLYFNITMPQLFLQRHSEVVSSSSLFKRVYSVTDKFFYLRAYWRAASTQGQWLEMGVTYQDKHYDPLTPTLLVRKLESSVEVTLPLVYTSFFDINSDLLIHVYSTKGELRMDLQTYPIDEYRLFIDTADKFNNTSDNRYLAYKAFISARSLVVSKDYVDGGSDEIDFGLLRQRTIQNALSTRQLPITGAQSAARFVSEEGFELIRGMDVLTNRIFLAVRKLSKPLQPDVKTSANIGIASVVFDSLTSSTSLVLNGQRATLKSNSLFEQNNAVTRLINNPATDPFIGNQVPLETKLNHLNDRTYLYNPFYYVLDSTFEKFTARAYELDNPELSLVSFEQANTTMGLQVSTDTVAVERYEDGYRVLIKTLSTSAYKELFNDLGDSVPTSTEAACSVALWSPKTQSWAYFVASPRAYYTDSEIIFECLLTTTLDVDADHLLNFNNASLTSTAGNEHTWVSLSARMRIFHLVVRPLTGYLPTSMDSEFGQHALTNQDLVPASMQSVTCTFGHNLSNLWVQSRPIKDASAYQTYQTDIPKVHTKDIYEIDPETGSPFVVEDGELTFLPKVAEAGDIVEVDGEVVYEHRVGEPILVDGQYLPKPSVSGVARVIDLLFVDAKYLYATASSVVEYRKELVRTLREWITESVARLQSATIDSTPVFFYPKTSLTEITAITDTQAKVSVAAQQSLEVKLIVSQRVFNSPSLRKEFSDRVIEVLDQNIDAQLVSSSSMNKAIAASLGSEVAVVETSGFGSEQNHKVLRLPNDHSRLSLKKKLMLKPNSDITLVEDVVVTFVNVDNL